MLPPQLRPALHIQHTFLPASINTIEPGSPSPRTPPPPSKGVKSQPAKGGQSLTGADKARRKDGKQFTSFSPAISPEALKAKSDRLRALRIHRHTDLSLDDLARWLNPIIAGWMNYYGRYYRSALEPLLQRVSTYLRRWARKKYKRLRTVKRFKRWWTGLLEREPGLFAHWRWVRAY